MFKLESYESIVFDCDGVILNSNKIKTLAFYEATKHFGHEFAQALLDYHIENGGISRYSKFEYFITKILAQDLDQRLLAELLEKFANAVKQGLMTCEVTDGLKELREQTKNSRWLIVSGGDQAELREVFAERGLSHYFDGGIFGSPDTKDSILEREKANQNISASALFLGDSKYDYQAANKAGLDFIFISQWTEVNAWQSYVEVNNLCSVSSLKNLYEQ